MRVVDDFHSGDTLTILVDITDPESGDAVDISGMLFIVTMKSDVDMPDAEAEFQVKKTAPDGSTSGHIEIEVASDETDVEPGRFYIDLRRIIPGAPPDVWTIFSHPLKVLSAVGTATA